MSKSEGFTMIENSGALTGGRLKELCGSELSVWLILKRFHNAGKGYAFASIPRIARETGYPPRTVERALKGLECKGWARTLRQGGGKRASHRIPTVPDALPPTDATGVDDAPTGAPGEPRQDRRGSTDTCAGGPPTETTGQVPTQATGVQDYSQNQKQNHPHNTSGSAEEGEEESDFFSKLGKANPPTWEEAEDKLREFGVSQATQAIKLAQGHGWQPIDIADLIEDRELSDKPALLYSRVRDKTKSKMGPHRKELHWAKWFAENAEQVFRDRAKRLDEDLARMAGQLAGSLPIDEARQAAAHILATSRTGEAPEIVNMLRQAGEWLRMNEGMRESQIEESKRNLYTKAVEHFQGEGIRRNTYSASLIEKAEAYLLDLVLGWPERTGPQTPRETRQSTETGVNPIEAQNAGDGQHGDDERLDAIKAKLQAGADRRIERARALLDLAAGTLIEDRLTEREARNTAATLYGLGLEPIDGEAEDATRERVRAFKRDELGKARMITHSIGTHRLKTLERASDQAREDHLADFPPTRDELLTGGSWATIDGLADFASEQEQRVLDTGREWFAEWEAAQPKPEPTETTEPAESTEGSTEYLDPLEAKRRELGIGQLGRRLGGGANPAHTRQ
jgi:hypothetical protein